jgi:hypothetical protein
MIVYRSLCLSLMEISPRHARVLEILVLVKICLISIFSTVGQTNKGIARVRCHQDLASNAMS